MLTMHWLYCLWLYNTPFQLLVTNTLIVFHLSWLWLGWGSLLSLMILAGMVEIRGPTWAELTMSRGWYFQLSFDLTAHLGILWPSHSKQRCPESKHSKEGARQGWSRAGMPSLAFCPLAHLEDWLRSKGIETESHLLWRGIITKNVWHH